MKVAINIVDMILFINSWFMLGRFPLYAANVIRHRWVEARVARRLCVCVPRYAILWALLRGYSMRSAEWVAIWRRTRCASAETVGRPFHASLISLALKVVIFCVRVPLDGLLLCTICNHSSTSVQTRPACFPSKTNPTPWLHKIPLMFRLMFWCVSLRPLTLVGCAMRRCHSCHPVPSNALCDSTFRWYVHRSPHRSWVEQEIWKRLRH